MHITKLQLENIKSHAESTFEFARGTTAIVGENGAGKTTIIEAIAWTLFDVLDYKKDDFLKRGAKKGIAKVSFISGLDEREYTVVRDTGTGYHVLDTEFTNRIADKKEEVTMFLRQHLGVEPGTDLESLFRRAIGVPQGTFTAIFLEGATERKKAFDKLLKVEEYRQGADKLRETTRFIENSVAQISESIARAEGELTLLDRFNDEISALNAEIEALTRSGETLDSERVSIAEKVAEFDKKALEIENLNSELDRQKNDLSRAELVFDQRKTELETSKNAAEKISTFSAGYERHLAVLAQITEMETRRAALTKLQQQLAAKDFEIQKLQAELARSRTELENSRNAKAEVPKLEEKIAAKASLETERAALNEKTAASRAAETHLKSIDRRLEELRETYRKNEELLKTAESSAKAAADLPELETQFSEVTRKISDARAQLARDEQFQKEIRGGLCPILSEKCLNLKPGETLESFVSSQFTELRANIFTLEKDEKNISEHLKFAREAHRNSANLDFLEAEKQRITDEGTRIRDERAEVAARTEDNVETDARLKEIYAQISELNEAESELIAKRREAAREDEISKGIEENEVLVQKVEAERSNLNVDISSFGEMETQFTALTTERDETAVAHRNFLTNEREAALFTERENALKATENEAAAIGAKIAESKNTIETASAAYDRHAHDAAKQNLRETEQKLTENRVRQENSNRRKIQIEKDVARLEETKVGLVNEFRERERLQKVGEATTFIRNTLKDAAPYIAKNYVHHVSIEANQMFREISGNAERTLKWNDEYGIELEEGGHARPFISLSGGEQMAAALSVRLALLKQLSDIRIAFFDEPTMNMDAQRRERLAEQISTITAGGRFDQLFVVSHDDTFENYVDNQIEVG